MIRKTLLAGIFACLSTLTLLGVPAYPGWLTHTQPDGSIVTYRLCGDEHCHAMISQDGRLMQMSADGWMTYDAAASEPFDFTGYYQQHAGMSRVKKDLDIDGFPTSGTIRGLILLVEFSDNSFYEEYTRDVFDSLMNQNNCSLYGHDGSSRDYFTDQSMGVFTPEFDVYGPIKLSNTIQYYGQNDGMGQDRRAHLMVKQACVLAHDSLGVDFGQYDFDEDGNVDFVYVIYAGYGENYGASSNTIWPHASNLSVWGSSVELDGKTVDKYACSCELQNTTGHKLEGIGTFCHEFGHVLGLPDMYNVYQSYSTQLGSWDIMDSGSYNNDSRTPPSYSAFERASLGWLTFEDIDTPSDTMSLPELTQSNVAYRLRTVYDNEYFTLENRQQVGWDAHQPGTGLMIIHVDYSESAWRNNTVNAGTHARYDLVEANGRQGRDMQNNLYPTSGNNTFTDFSSPNSQTWDGTPTEKGLTNIRAEDGVVKFSFMHDRLQRPVVNDTEDIAATSATVSWQPVDEASGYVLSIREELPDSINPLLLGEDFALMSEGTYPNAALGEITSDLDDYTKVAGWEGNRIYQAGGYVRIGAYGTSGSLTTPAISADEDTDSVTVAFHAVSYPGKSVSYDVTMTDIITGETQTKSLKATRREEGVVLTFGNPGMFKITFDSQQERLFLNDLYILRDTLSGIWTAGPKEWQVEGITDTAYLIEGLTPSRTYWFKVKAVADNGLADSEYTDEESFTTLSEATGIATAQVLQGKPAVTCYDISGRRVSSSARGLVIQHVTTADGQHHVKTIMRR